MISTWPIRPFSEAELNDVAKQWHSWRGPVSRRPSSTAWTRLFGEEAAAAPKSVMVLGRLFGIVERWDNVGKAGKTEPNMFQNST